MASSAPLPPGWEARWDPNQRAFFYINHSTKQTTWQDPRATHQPQPQAQQYGRQGGYQQPFAQYHQQAATSLNQPTHHQHQASGGHGQSIAMTTKYKQFGSTITSTEGESDEDFDTNTDFDLLFGSSAHHDEDKVDMQKLHTIKGIYPDAPEELIKDKLKMYKNVQVKVTNDLFSLGYKREAPGSHPAPKRDDIMQRLRAMFPTAAEDIVSEILRSANNDEKQARTQLETLGFSKVFPETHRSRTPNRQASPSRSSSSTHTSPVKRTPSPKPTSPAKPKMSEADKRKVERKIHGQFPSYDISVVKMALQVCNYDESRVKAVLERMGETSLAEGRKAPPSRPGTSRTRTRSPSPKPLSPSSLEPVGIMDDTVSSDPRPSTSSSGSRSTTPSRTSYSTRPSSSKTSARTPSPKKTTHARQQQQARAKRVTEMSKDILSSTIHTLNSITNNVPCCGRGDLPPADSANQSSPQAPISQSAAASQSHDQDSTRSSQHVVSRQPQGSEFKSEYRTEAKGPDPTLWQGPNKNLLLTDYTQAKGPNPELRQGPDPGRVRGSQGANGPDRSLHCGPEAQLIRGPSNQNLLVSAI